MDKCEGVAGGVTPDRQKRQIKESTADVEYSGAIKSGGGGEVPAANAKSNSGGECLAKNAKGKYAD